MTLLDRLAAGGEHMKCNVLSPTREEFFKIYHPSGEELLSDKDLSCSTWRNLGVK